VLRGAGADARGWTPATRVASTPGVVGP